MRKIFNMENLICLTVFLLPSYLIRFQILGVPTNILELLILLTAFVCFSQSANRQLIKKYVREYVRGYVLSALLIMAGLLLSITVNENYRDGLGILKSWFILPILFALTIIVTAKHGPVQEKILKALYFSTFGVSLIALFYFFADKLTYDGRLAAFYLSPNYLAMFLAPGLVFSIWYLVSSAKNFKFKSADRRINLKLFFLIFSFFTITVSFYLTYSYAAWMAVIGSFILISLITQINSHSSCHPASAAADGSRINSDGDKELDSPSKGIETRWSLYSRSGYGNDTIIESTFIKKNLSKVIIITSVLISVIIFLQWNNPKFQDLITFDERSSLASRMMIWKSAAKIALDNPLFGIGPGNFQNKYLEYQKYFPFYLEWAVPQPHNLYLAFWLQSGLLGLFGFLRLITLWIKPVLSILRQKKNDFFSLETALLGIMFYILLHGLLDTTYWKNDLAVIFWLVFTLGILAKQLPSLHTK